MKVLLMIPQRYGLFASLKDAFETLGAEIHAIDFYQFINPVEKKINVQAFRLPDTMRKRWENYYLKKINKEYRSFYGQIKPDLVFIYNNEMLLPETVAYFKRHAKVAFFLGDHPLYTPLNRYFLALLFQADAIFAPDSFWISQLSKMGINNIHHFCPGIPEQQYYEKNESEENSRKYKNDVLYIGMCYANNWGYKKARFLNHFTDFDLQIFGNKHWKRWFVFFPKLAEHFHLKTKYYPEQQMNEMFNATRIIPIDGNPGVLQGIHFRMFEALGAGALPLLEWQDDLKIIFPEDAELPAPKTYEEIQEMTAYYLSHEIERKAKVSWMKKVIREKYAPEKNGRRIAAALSWN
jgi:hypothetical protein